jgi:two-component system, NtrC family, nitrogen regulation sensor histidine kinase NtrY
MDYRRFRLQCITRILLLGGSIYLFFYLLLDTSYRATTLVVALIIVYQVYALIHYVEKTNRDLSRFFLAIKHADFSQSFVSGNLGSSFDELKRSFNEVLDSFRHARAEREEQARYLQTVVQHVGIGLIAFRRDGEVELINAAAKRLLNLTHLKNVHTLQERWPQLAASLLQLSPGQRDLVKIEEDDRIQQLIVYATAFRMREQEYILASLQNIQGELEEQEMEAWQKLIRVLTHEIMNSITPIASLAGTVNDMLHTADPADETLADTREALQTIERRSQGLLHFVDTYRDLTHLPTPDFQIVPAAELCARVARLMRPQLEKAGIPLDVAVEPRSLELTADPEQIEQVLINLIRNAMQAAIGQTDAHIHLRAGMDGRGRPLIEVTDDGPGIVEEALDRIFIPFFTTKQDGSGIGLSLCRQIMRLHHGTISARSTPGEETVFTLRF